MLSARIHGRVTPFRRTHFATESMNSLAVARMGRYPEELLDTAARNEQ